MIMGKLLSLDSYLSPLENGALPVFQSGQGNYMNLETEMWTLVR